MCFGRNPCSRRARTLQELRAGEAVEVRPMVILNQSLIEYMRTLERVHALVEWSLEAARLLKRNGSVRE